MGSRARPRFGIRVHTLTEPLCLMGSSSRADGRTGQPWLGDDRTGHIGRVRAAKRAASATGRQWRGVAPQPDHAIPACTP